MSTHNIDFYEDLTKIICEISSNIIKYAGSMQQSHGTGLYHQCSENKGADQLYNYRASDQHLFFAYMQKSRLSHEAAYIFVHLLQKKGTFPMKYLCFQFHKTCLLTFSNDSAISFVTFLCISYRIKWCMMTQLKFKQLIYLNNNPVCLFICI